MKLLNWLLDRLGTWKTIKFHYTTPIADATGEVRLKCIGSNHVRIKRILKDVIFREEGDYADDLVILSLEEDGDSPHEEG